MKNRQWKNYLNCLISPFMAHQIIKKHKGVLSFNIQDIHPHDVSSLVDYHGNIALRAGNHCAHPLLKYLNAQSTNRISFYFYNTKEDV